MRITPFLKRICQWKALIVIYAMLFAARVGYLWYERSRPLKLPASRQVTLRKVDPDYLVVIPRFKVVDMADAQTLNGTTLWVKGGSKADFILVDSKRHKLVDEERLRLPPMTEIQVSRVFEYVNADRKPREVFLGVIREGREFAVRIGLFDDRLGIHRFDLDDLFYLQNPRQLYSHWTAETWLNVETHQIKPQMTYAQVALSLGIGALIRLNGQNTQIYRFSSHPGGAAGITDARFVDGRLADYQTN
jgi:hypothetical protein